MSRANNVNSTELLAAPCLFCGYNGAGYWQRGTHHKRCPWHHVGGECERAEKLPRMVNRAMIKAYGPNGEITCETK